MSLKRKAGDAPTSDAKKPRANASITSFFTAPKPAPKASGPASNKTAGPGEEQSASLPVSKFNKEKWLATLNDEQKELLKLEIETLHESWLKELKEEILTKDFLELKRFLKREKEQGKKVFPPEADIYSWFAPFFTLMLNNLTPSLGPAIPPLSLSML
jgi:uracil-DNA glycosylase